jgi:chemotaxis protein MotB
MMLYLSHDSSALQLRYDTTMENLLQQITGKNRDLSKVNRMLEQRTRELNEKEQSVKQKEQAMLAQQQDLEEQLASLAQSELAANDALEAKQRELESLRVSVQKALVGFADKGLDVNVKDGKVYVSMADKLLFASGSWEVSAQGVQALKSLAKVLENNPDLNVVVEGHTDNDAYHGSTAVKDNWDLSVIRATSVVRILTETYGVNPLQILPCGRGEFKPVDVNTTTEGKARNRRTEIIMAPQLDKLFKMLEESGQ